MFLPPKWTMVRWTARRRGRQHQEIDGKSSRKILGSAREVFKWADEKIFIYINQDHFLEKPTQLAVVLFPRTPLLLFIMVIIVNYNDSICWPEKCSAKHKQNTTAFRLPRPPALTGYIVSNCLPDYDWFSEVLGGKPQSKQTTTALDQKSRFISTTVFRVLINVEEFILLNIQSICVKFGVWFYTSLKYKIMSQNCDLPFSFWDTALFLQHSRLFFVGQTSKIHNKSTGH